MTLEAFTILDKQPHLAEMMRNVVVNNKLGHAYIFEGMRGAGQLDMAIYVAAILFCEETHEKPCGKCLHCQRVLKGEYPDVEYIKPDGNTIKIEQIRDLKQALALTAMESDSKIFIIEEADLMTANAANSLLKFLEEPNKGIYIFLLTAHAEAILQTIQSRTQMVYFPPLKQNQLQGSFEAMGMTSDIARIISEITNDINYGMTLLTDEVFNKQLKISLTWLENILKNDARAFTMVASDWGKITKDRRESIRGLDLVLFYVRDLLYLSLYDTNMLNENNQLIYPFAAKCYQEYTIKTSVDKLVSITELINKAQKMINSNVSVQAAYEYLVLAIWRENNQK